MKTKSILSALKKAGLKVEQDGQRFHVQGSNRYGGFIDQEGSAICVYTCWNSLQSDSQTDYFPECYHRTLKDFVSYLQQ